MFPFCEKYGVEWGDYVVLDISDKYLSQFATYLLTWPLVYCYCHHCYCYHFAILRAFVCYRVECVIILSHNSWIWNQVSLSYSDATKGFLCFS